MDNGMAQVLESVFGRRELDRVSVEEIRGLIAEFPSFNAGHYLLSRKLKSLDALEYAAATRQTALYFNNPLWLQHLLEEPEQSAAAPQSAVYDGSAYWTGLERPAAAGETSAPVTDQPGSPAATVNEMFQAVNEEPSINEAVHSVQEETPVVNELIHPTDSALPTVNEAAGDDSGQSPILNDVLVPPTEQEIAVFDAGQVADNEELLDDTFAGVDQEDAVSPDDLPQPDPIYADNPSFEWPEDVAADTADPIEPAIAREAENAATAAPHVPPGISAELAAAAAGLRPDNTPDIRFDEKKAKAIVFEPYHTIDYFASQGIKLVLDDNPGDSFGRQLKSFTEWLKTMKRLPVQPLTGKADETETAEVKNFAAHSVEDRDILTETMAEVLVKQGMNDNAIAIYRKLSLIYPLKSAYFAARIEQLKAARS